MKHTQLILGPLVALGLIAQVGSPPQPTPEQAEATMKSLKSVTWHPRDCKMSWDIERDGKVLTFKIDLHEATMSLGAEVRNFDRAEADRVHELFGEFVNSTLSRYSVESTLWWDLGGGKKPREVARRQDGRP